MGAGGSRSPRRGLGAGARVAKTRRMPCPTCGTPRRPDTDAPATPVPTRAPAAVVELPIPATPLALTLGVPGHEHVPGWPANVDVVPGGHAALEARLRTTGAETGRFELAVEGIPRAWWSTEPGVVRLSRTYAEATVTIHFHPPRTAAAAARAWLVRVTACPSAAHASATLVLSPAHDLRLATYPEVSHHAPPVALADRRRARALAADLAYRPAA